MKKLRSLIVLLVMTLLLTGCVKYNVNMEIRKDKSMDFKIVYAIDKSLLQGKEAFDEKEVKQLKDKGFEVEPYSKDNMEGFTITKKIKNIDDVSSPDAKEYSLSGITKEGDSKLFKVKKGLFKNKYTANLKFSSSDSSLSNGNDDDDDDDYTFNETLEDTDDDSDDDSWLTDDSDDSWLTDDDDDTTSSDDYDYSSMYNMDMSVNVKLPYKALSNNASSVENDGKDLKWNLTTSGTESIDFEFELYNMTTIYLFIGLGALVLVGIIVLVVVLVTKNSKKNKVVTQE